MKAEYKCRHPSFFYDKKVQKILLKWIKTACIPPEQAYTTAHLVHILLTCSHLDRLLKTEGPFSINRDLWLIIAKSFSSNILLFSELAVAIERYYRNLPIGDRIFDVSAMKYFPFLYSVKIRNGRIPRKLLSVFVFETMNVRISEKAALQHLYREVARRKNIDRKWNSTVNASQKVGSRHAAPSDGFYADPDRKLKNSMHFRTPAEARSILTKHAKFLEHRLGVMNKLVEEFSTSRSS